MGQKIKAFANKHGVEAALTLFGAAGLAMAGLPIFGLAGGAALAGEGIEMGALAEPLLGWGGGRVAAQAGGRVGPGLANRIANMVARRYGWDAVERFAGADAVDHWMI
jgi:hypothetical protein